MGRPALKTETPRDPSRVALAAAIAALAEQEAILATTREARERADNLSTAAFMDVEAAEVEIRAAKAMQRDEIMASVMRGDDTPSNVRLETAERRKADAEQRRTACRMAWDDLGAAVSAREMDVAAARAELRERRAAVLWDALPALVAASMPLREELAKYAQAISLITETSPGFMSADDPRRELMMEADCVRQPVLSPGSGVTLPTSAFAEWTAAIHRLTFDPDAPLPGSEVPAPAATVFLTAGA